MGEAKRRGTFEERRAEALKKPRAEWRTPIRPRGKSRLNQFLAVALAAGTGSFFPKK